MKLLRRIAIGIGVFALAIAIQKCATKCMSMLREGRSRNELVARGPRHARPAKGVAASEALAA
jgi:hypothetical protein